jgi:hypothetical protein
MRKYKSHSSFDLSVRVSDAGGGTVTEAEI